MSDSIQNILEEFEKQNINYVHWKSNTNIEKALSGEDDLDILVDPNKKYDLYKIFDKYNVIRGYSEKDSWQNEIFHYFTMDTKKKKLVHIHLHFLLEVGYDLDKSLNLPIVDKYLQYKEKYKYIYIPIVENEYILLIIRLLLKNALLPFLMMLPGTQIKLYKTQKEKGVVRGSAYEEFVDLNNRINRDKLEIMLDEVFPFLEKKLFYKCEAIIKNNNSWIDFFEYSKKLKKSLNEYRYHGEFKSFLLSFYRINMGRLNKVFKNKRKSKKIPATKGKIFAFVGADGAGKTSNIEKLQKILKSHFYVRTIHIGRPNIYVIGMFFLIINKILKYFGQVDLSKAFVYLAIAHGRKKDFERALKLRSQGAIVILDRIPMDGINSMDCPRIHTISNNKYESLSIIERKMYNKIKEIDEIIILKLNPKIALKRRPEDDPNELLIRSGEVWNKDFSGIDNTHVINTDNTFEYVEENILNIIWNSISNKLEIYELLGLAGVGKSTICNLLQEKYNNKFIYNFENKKINIFLFKYLFIYVKLYLKTRNLEHIKALIVVHIFLNDIEEGNYTHREHFLFDQGPIFVTAMLIFEAPKLENYFLKDIARILSFYKKIIYLTAPFDVLCNRIDNRIQNHRIKNNVVDDQKFFLEKYQLIFEKIMCLGKDLGVDIIKIDTDKNNISQVESLIVELLRK